MKSVSNAGSGFSIWCDFLGGRIFLVHIRVGMFLKKFEDFQGNTC